MGGGASFRVGAFIRDNTVYVILVLLIMLERGRGMVILVPPSVHPCRSMHQVIEHCRVVEVTYESKMSLIFIYEDSIRGSGKCVSIMG